MPLYQLLTDRTLAQSSAITPTTLIHIVYTGDPSQNIAGSSYKAELQQLSSIFSGGTDTLVTGGTYSAGTITFTNSSGGTFDVTGLTTGATITIGGDYLPLSGGTVSGATNFTNGLTANTISASTLFVNGVQITGDTFVTGGTYSAGTITFTNNQNGQFPVTGLTEPFTGGSGNCITDLYITNLHGCSPITIHDNIQSVGSLATGATSFAFGDNVNAFGDYSHSEGIGTFATGFGSHAEGLNTSATTNNSHSEGYLTLASGVNSHAEGYQTISTGASSHSEGESTTATGTGSHAEGYQTSATTTYSHSEGQLTLASGNASHAEGSQTTAIGAGSHAEGGAATSFGINSHAEGSFTSSSGVSSHAEGSFTISSGIYSHSEGELTVSLGRGSHAEGYGSQSLSDHSHAEGYGTISSGQSSHTEGVYTYTLGFGSHAEGGFLTGITYFSGGTAIGGGSHAEGRETISSGISSHAEGYLTVSSGNYSHAEGVQTISYGEGSHTEGIGTIANGDHQHISGKYNLTGNTTQGAFIVGNGTSNTNRSNLIFAANSGVTITGTLSATTISATTYQNLPLDIKVTGATYSNNSFSYTNNTGGTYSVLFNTVTGLTVNGNLLVTGNTGLGTSSPSTKLQITANNNLNTANNVLRFEDTDTTAANNQMSGKIEFYTSDTTGAGVRSYIAGITDTAGNGKIIFGTALGSDTSLTGGTTTGERMRIDEDGYVGINESSPTYQFEVSSGPEVLNEIAAWIKNDNNKGIYIIPTAGDSGYNFNTRSGDTVVTTTQGQHLVVGAKDGAAFRFSGGTSSSNSGNTITTGNRIGIGTVFYDGLTHPSEPLDVNGNARFRAIGAGASAGALHYTSDGTLTTNTSDIRLKDNIQPLEGALEKLLKLTGVTYNWIGQEGKRIGFIAQEVEKVIPELVFINNNTEKKYKGIHQDNLTAILTEAIKEQQKIIEELKTEILNLKIRIDNL